jgi:hypothetical protein
MNTLQQRVDSYLRDKAPGNAADAPAPEAEFAEYMLQRAEADLRAAQKRLDQLKREIAKHQS